MAAKKAATAGAKLVKSAVRATAKKATKSATKKTAADTGASAKKSTEKKSAPAKKKTTKKSAPAKKAATKKAAPAKKSAPVKKSTAKKAAPARKSTPAAKKSSPAKKSAPKKTAPKQLVVREDESPWTAKELKEVRAELEGEIQRLQTEISSAETDLTEFLKEPIDGAGDDQADAGAKSFEREHELSLVAGARTGLEQNLHALGRLEDGTYGICESCGNPIGKLRLQAYPRATLCMSCKSTQERR